MNLHRAQQSFLSWLVPRKLSASTLSAYRQDLDLITRQLTGCDDSWQAEEAASKLSLRHVTKDRLRTAFAHYASTHAKSSILRAHSTWRQFFDYLVSDGIVEGNPMAAVNRPKDDPRSPKPLQGWDEDTLHRLLQMAASGERGGRQVWPELETAILATLLVTGVRRGELLGMNLDALEGVPGEEVLRVVGKGNKPRTIPVEDSLSLVLGRYLESRKARFVNWKQRSTDPLFVGARATTIGGGTRMTARQLDWLIEANLTAAGLANRRPKGAMAHAFRHTYGTSLAADGAPVAAIRKLMGHTSIVTSQGYIDSLAREERLVAKRNRAYDVIDLLDQDPVDHAEQDTPG